MNHRFEACADYAAEPTMCDGCGDLVVPPVKFCRVCDPLELVVGLDAVLRQHGLGSTNPDDALRKQLLSLLGQASSL